MHTYYIYRCLRACASSCSRKDQRRHWKGPSPCMHNTFRSFAATIDESAVGPTYTAITECPFNAACRSCQSGVHACGSIQYTAITLLASVVTPPWSNGRPSSCQDDARGVLHVNSGSSPPIVREFPWPKPRTSLHYHSALESTAEYR